MIVFLLSIPLLPVVTSISFRLLSACVNQVCSTKHISRQKMILTLIENQQLMYIQYQYLFHIFSHYVPCHVVIPLTLMDCSFFCLRVSVSGRVRNSRMSDGEAMQAVFGVSWRMARSSEPGAVEAVHRCKGQKRKRISRNIIGI